MSNQRSLTEIIDLISSESDLSKEEIIQRINSKMDELGEFVTQLGAAHIVAKEMNVDLSTEPSINVQSILNIDQLVPDIASVNLLGRVIRIYDQYNFKKKDGSDGVLQSLLIEDKTGQIRVVFWDQKAKELASSNCKTGDPIRIFNGYTKLGRDENVEVHLGSKSQVQIRPSGINEENLPTFEPSYFKASKLKGNEVDVSIVGKITQIDDILEFERSDGTKGKRKGITLGDETGEVFINFWNEKANKIDSYSLGDIIEIVGLTAKIGLKGFIELHSTRYTDVNKASKKEIIVKKGLIGGISDEKANFTKIAQLTDINQLYSTKGLIVGVNPTYNFTRDDGSKGKVRNLTISDNTGLIRVVLWDDRTKQITSADSNKILTIINGNTRKGRYTDIEIHCGNQTRMRLDEADDKDIKDQYLIEFDKINELSEDDLDVNITGVISDLPSIQEIETKDGEKIKLQNFRVEDQTGNIRITCWRDNVDKLSDFQVGDGIEIYGAKVKPDTGYGLELTILNSTILKKTLNNEMTSQGFISSLSVSNMDVLSPSIQDIEDIKEGEDVVIQATVIKLFEKQFVYPLCPECKKKMKKEENKFVCAKHGDMEKPLNRIFFTFTVNDGTGNINVLCAGKLAENVMGMSADSLAEMVKKQDSEKAPYSYLKSKDFVNSELIISGKVSENSFLKSLEIIAKSIEKVRFKDAIQGLIKNIPTN